MNHKKYEHAEQTQPCRNDMNGTCPYAPYSCWFKHAETYTANSDPGQNIRNDL